MKKDINIQDNQENIQSNTYYRALSIAGFDGSGGAGIQADLKTFSALGCYGMTVLTSLPAQNTQGVRSHFEISPQCIQDQLEAILEDIGADAIKIGMLYTCEIIHVVANVLKKHLPLSIVLDPVMYAKSGDSLIKLEAVETLKKELFPLTSVLTPNIPEACHLIGLPINSYKEMEMAGLKLITQGPQSIVVKGGHLFKEKAISRDCLILATTKDPHWLESPRVQTKNIHGTGCTFSSAITAFLAKGFNIPTSVAKAKEYLSTAITIGARYSIGKGHGPVHHFHNLWDQETIA